jgi:hypothetical protein
MAELEIDFLLPLPGWPRAVFESDYGYDGGRLMIDATPRLQAADRAALERGVAGRLAPGGATLELRLVRNEHGDNQIELRVDGRAASRRESLRARATRSVWVHALLALAASGAGFVASYLYVLRAAGESGDWALKMANHMAGWHLLLTLTLFPLSLYGQRRGIRLVQFVCLLFFLIHLGIGLSNVESGGGHSGAIALLNTASGLLFLAAAIHGNRAYRDMDPVEALREGRLRRG